ncbi:MAG: S8 family serine peptidase [Actinomycetota bacterium]|nr:S8 family serine peptidase [Actinomycetota bacterium]
MGPRRSLLRRAAVLVAGALLAGLTASSGSAEERARYIVVLERDVPAAAAAQEHSRSENAEIGFVYEHALNGYSAMMSPQAAQRIERDPRVAYVEPDLPVSASAQLLPTGVDRIDGELSPTARIDGVDERVDADIAILDTGIDLDHPDLNVVANTGCASGGPMNRTCTNGNGDDNNWHGTHVAGIAAALDNGIGVVGVAPGARLHAVKVLDSRGSGYVSWIIAGIDWVTARASTIEVANMSLGGLGHTVSYRTAIQNSVAKGVVYYVAAGNEMRDVYGPDGVFGNSDDTQPAAFPEVGTISALADFDGRPGGLGSASYSYGVGCTENRDDSFACFSNYARNVTNNPVTSSGGKIDMMLPGVQIASTYPGAQYAYTHGTSQASPHAAGLAALYVARNGRATTAAGVYSIRQALINAGYGQTTTNGLTTHDDPDLRKEPLGWGATL